jgi:ABC-type transport system involved in Fe-S cluster assembly fused permease/ATPase subunit
MRHGNYQPEQEGQMNWRIVSALWPYLMQFKGRLVVAMLFLVASKSAILLIPFLLKSIVDTLDIADKASVATMVILGVVLAYGAARFANVMFGEIRDTIFGRITERAMHFLGMRVFRHLHALDLDYHLSRQTGGLARDIERGTTGISFLMRFFVFNIVPTLFEISAVVIILLLNYGIAYAAITFVSVTAYGAFSVWATEWRTKYVREANEADSKSNTRAIDSLMNFETVKYFTNEEFEAQRYDRDLQRWEDARRKNRLSMFGLNGGQALIIAVAQTSMIGLAAFEIRSGVVSLGDFVLINAFMIQLFLPLGFLGFVYREIKGSLANIERLFNLLDVKPTVVDAPDAKPLNLTTGRITFDHVSFSYQSERGILDDVSFTIEPGQKVAIVGASGAGKSTLVKLLFRFYDTTAGAILLDGQDIRSVKQDSLRRQIGIVPQDTVLFNDNIFENVRYGRPDASDHEVENAIRLAHLKDFIDELPVGGATQVGERGLKLSGGEKQRVAIARTILKRPPIMVFDEATSSLDSRSEQAILAALREIAEEHTSMVIAHRLSTIIDADSIIVLDHGRVVEQGSHDVLLARDGHYADLWRAQQKQQAVRKAPTESEINTEEP